MGSGIELCQLLRISPLTFDSLEIWSGQEKLMDHEREIYGRRDGQIHDI